MSATPRYDLSVEARRCDFLSMLHSLKVLRKALVVGLTVNGKSRGLSNTGQGRLNLAVMPIASDRAAATANVRDASNSGSGNHLGRQ